MIGLNFLTIKTTIYSTQAVLVYCAGHVIWDSFKWDCLPNQWYTCAGKVLQTELQMDRMIGQVYRTELLISHIGKVTCIGGKVMVFLVPLVKAS